MPSSQQQITQMQDICNEARKWIIRMISRSGSGHLGGSMSVVEILVTLYFHQMKTDPQNLCWPERDRMLLSKGHAGPGLYAVLAMRGYISTDELFTLDQPGTRLSKHVDRIKLPACDISSGMLGQGLSMGVGMALGARMAGNPSHIYVVMSDGDVQSGQTWEAVMAGAKYGLDNLTAIVDRNRLQVDGASDDIMPVDPLDEKWRAFGWNVLEVDGHDIEQVLNAYDAALTHKSQPTVIIANTVKGKGVSFAEGQVAWHNQVLSEELAQVALADLGERP